MCKFAMHQGGGAAFDNMSNVGNTEIDDTGNPVFVDPVSIGDSATGKLYQHNEHVGDIATIKEKGHSRLIFPNPNGMHVGPGNDVEAMLQDALEMDADYMHYSETKLATDRKRVKSQMHSHLRKILGTGQYRALMGASSIDHGIDRKPGGIMSITFGAMSGRIVDTGVDYMGRWTYTKFNRNDGRLVTIIGLYQPPEKSAEQAGDTTALKQQHAMLMQEDRDQPHRVRHHFANDLISFVKQCQANGDRICVGGDFNETLGDTQDGLTKLCTECHLLDVVQLRHNTDSHTFNTWIRGSKCIDYILMDEYLAPSVVACGYTPFLWRTTGDHRQVWADVNTKQFFGSAHLPLTPYQHRNLHSRKFKTIGPYFKELDKQLQANAWKQQIQQLQDCIDNDKPNDELAETLDKRRIAACKAAEQSIKKYPKAPFSPAISRLRNINAILRAALFQYANPQDDYHEAIDRLHFKLGSFGITTPFHQQLKNVEF